MQVLPIAMLPKDVAVLRDMEVRPETRRMGEVPQIFADAPAAPRR